jgi:CheY-like chemotaxis protein
MIVMEAVRVSFPKPLLATSWALLTRHASGEDENGPQPKVLIVDDEYSLRRVLRVSLTTLGFKTEEASTGKQALALLGIPLRSRASRHDMPGKGGIETCTEIRRLSRRPVVFILTVRDGKRG